MADKGWTARIATAAGAAAGTGAAQLGLGYGLGVVVWPVTATPDDSAWLGSLGWATWITASATVFGAVLGSRYRGGPGPRTNAAWRFALAACAAVGALVTVALIALPARSAVRLDAYTPQVLAGGYAAIGLLFGLVVAFWAVSSRPVAANLMATGVWLWALAIAAIVVELTVNRDSATYLTSWQFAEVASSGRFGTIYWPSALLTLGAAFLVGALAAAPAARRGDLGVGAATSGVAGPLLVAVAFLALAPRLTGALGPIESAYLIAPYAVLAGLAGSVLAVATARAMAARRSRRASARTTGTARVPETRAPAPVTPAPVTPAPVTPAPVTPAPVTPSSGAPEPQDSPDPAAAPAKPRPRLFGRAKPRVSPTTDRGGPADAAQSRSDQDISHQSGASRPSATESAQLIAGPGQATRQAAADSGQAVTGAGQAGAGSGQTAPDQRLGSKAAPRSSGKPSAAPIRDSEIASAARPRPRPRKVATDAPKPPPKSTVTPPPPAPTVAQINPKPTSKD